MKIRLILLASIGLLLIGCAKQPNSVQGVPIYNPKINTQKAELELAQSAKSISSSLQELAEIQRATHPTLRLPKPPNANKIGMDQVVYVDWAGPIEPLIKNIAKTTHYKLRVLGKAPAIPVLVSVHKKRVTAAQLLRDAGFQAGTKVDIVVYPRSKVIELRYAKV